MIVKFESSFDFYKKSLLKYIKDNGNNKLSPQQISILKFENKNDKNKLAKMLKDIDKKHFNKFINTKELTKNELKIDALMNNLNKEQYIKKLIMQYKQLVVFFKQRLQLLNYILQYNLMI